MNFAATFESVAIVVRDIEEAYNTTVPTAAVTTCPNFYKLFFKVCVQFYSILPMGWEFFKFFDWFLICVAVPAMLAYLSIMASYINAYREDKTGKIPKYWTHVPFYTASCGFIMHLFGAFSHITLYLFTGNVGTAVFVLFWAPSFVMYWFVTITIVAHFFNYYILKWSDVSVKSAKSPYVYGACIVAGAAALLYCGYIIIVTILYKSLIPRWVNIGWYIMVICYGVVALNSLPMFWVVKFIREKANETGKENIVYSARAITWWTGITISLQLFSILTILWFNNYKGEVATNLPADASLLLKIQRAAMQSMLTRFSLNIWNNIQSVMNIYFLCHGMKNIIPFADLVWFFSSKRRKEAYKTTAKSGTSSSGRKSRNPADSHGNP
jgi:hypothetical protein